MHEIKCEYNDDQLKEIVKDLENLVCLTEDAKEKKADIYDVLSEIKEMLNTGSTFECEAIKTLVDSVIQDYNNLYKPTYAFDIKVDKNFDYVSSLAVSPFNYHIAAGFNNGYINLWDGNNGKLLWSLKKYDSVNSVRFDDSGEVIEVYSDCFCGACMKSFVKTCNGEVVRQIKGDMITNKSSRIGQFDKYYINIKIDINDTQKVEIWNLSEDRMVNSFISDNSGFINAAELDYTKNRIAVAYAGKKDVKDPVVIIWDINDKNNVIQINCHAVSLAFDQKGLHLACGCFDGTVLLYDFKNHESKELKGHSEEVRLVLFDPSGLSLSSESRDSAIVWKVTNGSIIHKFKGHSYFLRSVSYGASGDRLIRRTSDYSGQLINVKSGEVERNFGHVQGLFFGQKGDIILTHRLEFDSEDILKNDITIMTMLKRCVMHITEFEKLKQIEKNYKELSDEEKVEYGDLLIKRGEKESQIQNKKILFKKNFSLTCLYYRLALEFNKDKAINKLKKLCMVCDFKSNCIDSK